MIYFEQMLNQIYSTELQLDKAVVLIPKKLILGVDA